MKRFAGGLAVCSLLLAGCGTASDGESRVTFPGPASTSAPGSAVSAGPAAGLAATATPEEAASRASGAPKGRQYQDPQEKYTISLDPHWTASSGPTNAEYWIVGKTDHGFKSMINITTEDLTGLAQGISAATYLRLSVKNLKAAGFKVIKQGYVQGYNTEKLGSVEYTGSAANTGAKIHLLALFDMDENTAVVATLGTSQQIFSKAKATVQPYMRTLKVVARST